MKGPGRERVATEQRNAFNRARKEKPDCKLLQSRLFVIWLKRKLLPLATDWPTSSDKQHKTIWQQSKSSGLRLNFEIVGAWAPYVHVYQW